MNFNKKRTCVSNYCYTTLVKQWSKLTDLVALGLVNRRRSGAVWGNVWHCRRKTSLVSKLALSMVLVWKRNSINISSCIEKGDALTRDMDRRTDRVIAIDSPKTLLAGERWVKIWIVKHLGSVQQSLITCTSQ